MYRNKGVYYNSHKGKYTAYLYTKGRRTYIGDYPNEYEAHLARNAYIERLASDDYNLLAKDPVAWERKAKEIITKLSKEELYASK